MRLGDTIVKRFRQLAPNQEAILAAFEEEGWPARIDDPLTNGDNVDAQDRLHDTVRRLNQRKVPLIRFLSDGRGEGVMWELRVAACILMLFMSSLSSLAKFAV